jgi:major vault protein
LLELQAENAAIEATGQATAQARAKAQAAQIQGEITVNLAQQEVQAAQIRQEAELAHQQALSALEIEKTERMSQITSVEFRQKIEALGAETIKAIAQAGPEMQARLLEALGIQSVLITDGRNPINLFGTANGLISPLTSGQPSDS